MILESSVDRSFFMLKVLSMTNLFGGTDTHRFSQWRYTANGALETSHGCVATPCNRNHYYASLRLALERLKHTLHGVQPRILG